MQSGLYVGISSQIALERRLNTIADNMANMNTVGFRSTEVKFDEVMSKTQNDIGAKVAFVTQGNDYLSTRTGDMQRTGNPLDFAVKGNAWFQLDTPAGKVLTRDGRFTMDEPGPASLDPRLCGSRCRRRADPAESRRRPSDCRLRRHHPPERAAGGQPWSVHG